MKYWSRLGLVLLVVGLVMTVSATALILIATYLMEY